MAIYDIKVEIVKLDRKYFPPILELKTTITNNLKKKLPVLLYYSIFLHSNQYEFSYWLNLSPPQGKRIYKHKLLLEEVLFRKVSAELGMSDPLFVNVKGVLVTVGGRDITNHSEAIQLDKKSWILTQQEDHKPHGKGIAVSSPYEAMMRNKMKGVLEEEPILENKIPKVLKLHTKIVSASEKLFHDRHYSQAIFEAVKVLEKEIKSKSGIKNKSGVPLVNKVFNEDHPIIKIVEGDEQEDVDEREGFRFLYMGTIRGIKNPKSHSIQNLSDPTKALEYLSFISLLMKRLDESTVSN